LRAAEPFAFRAAGFVVATGFTAISRDAPGLAAFGAAGVMARAVASLGASAGGHWRTVLAADSACCWRDWLQAEAQPVGHLAAGLAAFLLPDQEGVQGDFVMGRQGGVQRVHFSVLVCWFKTPLLAVQSGGNLAARPAPTMTMHASVPVGCGEIHPCGKRPRAQRGSLVGESSDGVKPGAAQGAGGRGARGSSLPKTRKNQMAS
jgi:hypothetical protein